MSTDPIDSHKRMNDEIHMKSQLYVPEIHGHVHLGCLEEERLQTQEVKFALQIDFKTLPPTCETDDVAQTPCYAQMSDLLQELLTEKHFNTIEHLGLLSFQKLRTYLGAYPETKNLKLTINKLKPPIDTLTNGCHFTLEDQL